MGRPRRGSGAAWRERDDPGSVRPIQPNADDEFQRAPPLPPRNTSQDTGWLLFCNIQCHDFTDSWICQGCVTGKFVVHEDLPPHLAQGMFAKPGSYDVIMRYSSLTPKLVPDNVPAPRGIGMKIFGVQGEKIWGEDKQTQDWTFNNYPVLELRTPKDTYEIADSLERNWNDIPKFAEELRKRQDAEVACLPAQLAKQQRKFEETDNTYNTTIN